MNRYRTHTCGELRASDKGKEVKFFTVDGTGKSRNIRRPCKSWV